MNICEFVPAQNRYQVVRPSSPGVVRSPVRPQFFQILRKAKFYLRIQPDFDSHIDEGDESDHDGIKRAFSEEFRKVWLSLRTDRKYSYRRDMLHYWAQAAQQPAQRVIFDDECRLIAGYEQPTKAFTFNYECVELAIQHGQLRNLIAHEFGHAWHDTQDESNIRLHGPVTPGSETEADDIATQWGYNMVSLQAWRDANSQQINIFTGRVPRPFPPFDPSVLEGF